MNILITGGTGFVGEKILDLLQADNKIKTISLTTRNQSKYEKLLSKYAKVKLIEWDSNQELSSEDIKDIDAVINLQGENISNGRWTEEQRSRIYNSRVKGTNILIDSLLKYSPNLSIFIQTSAIRIYPVDQAQKLTETSKVAPEGFLPKVCKDWEAPLERLTSNIRVVTLRVGVVFDKTGGAIAKMKLPFLLGLGGILGSGKQEMSWIHRSDLASLYHSALVSDAYQGVYNAVAPEVITNYKFTKTLGRIIKRPTIFPVPALMLKLLFGEMSSLLLDSQHVESTKLPQAGFQFQYPTLQKALEEIF